ncbi:hypothetical protein V6Z11_1Z011800 [Gossypium hirsutum]
MELLHKFSFRLLPPVTFNFNHTRLASLYLSTRFPVSGPAFSDPGPLFTSRRPLKKTSLPEIVKAGDPVLHEPAKEVDPGEIGSERIQNIIADMVRVMRMAPGVGLAAPQIGIPLRIIVLEDTTEYISYAPKEEIKAQDRRPFDLLVIINPKLKKRSNRSALFFEGCLSVDGFRAVVERHLDVEVTGFGRDGQPIKVDASGWQARILQHECDHLDGTLYVDKMVPRTFRTVQNLDLPLAEGCPKLGAR